MIATINYSEMLQAYMSFVTSAPEWYFDFEDKYYSIDSNNTIILHNSSNLINCLSGDVDIYDDSEVTIVVNDEYQSTKVFDTVEYAASFDGSDNFSSIEFNTQSQSSNEVVVDSIQRREDTYKFSIPRSNELEMYGDRMRGKYINCKYKYTPIDGRKFSVPYIKTTFRHSMI